MLLVDCVVRGFEDLLIPLKGVDPVEIPATTASHNLTVCFITTTISSSTSI